MATTTVMHKQLFINVHLDGLRETHDLVCDRKGVYDKALEMIRESKRRGYITMTNTTVFKETSMDEVESLCRILHELHVDGMLISPGYHYESVERDIFLTQNDIHEKFQRLIPLSKRYKLTATPVYMEFAAGQRELPWSTPPSRSLSHCPRSALAPPAPHRRSRGPRYQRASAPSSTARPHSRSRAGRAQTSFHAGEGADRFPLPRWWH